jgi:hypothetical protein
MLFYGFMQSAEVLQHLIQGDSVARGPKLLSICGTQANASHWTSPIYRGGPRLFSIVAGMYV